MGGPADHPPLLAKMWVFLVCLTALLVKLSHWIYTQKNSKSCNWKLPPGSMGFPIIGETIFCWSQILHILPSICEGFILPSQIRFFERAFWVRHKFLVANRHFINSFLPRKTSLLFKPFACMVHVLLTT